MDILELLRYVIKLKIFSLDDFNERIKSLKYRFSDARDIPTVLSKTCEKLPGKLSSYHLESISLFILVD